MARAESKMIMGYLPIDPKHHAAITSLVAPATLAHRLLDPVYPKNRIRGRVSRSGNALVIVKNATQYIPTLNGSIKLWR